MPQDNPNPQGNAATQMLSITTRQFQELLQAVGNGKKTLLSECPARFNGARSSTAVEAFISGVATFKKVEELDDKHILEGLPLILQDDAAVWWQGVKHEIGTWKEFENRLRHAYAPKKPAYQIIQEIIEVKQDRDTPTEIFIQKKRALIAQLPPPRVSEELEIDMVFGQLRFEIRDRMSRELIEDFKDLSEKARSIERSLGERALAADRKEVIHNTKHKLRCNYCRAPGHTADVCRKLARISESTTVKEEGPSMAANTSFDPLKPKFKCYGCGEPGVVRSQCKKCNEEKVKLQEIGFCSSITSTDKRSRPTIPIRIGTIQAIGYVDTCARSSVASYQLYLKLKEGGYKFQPENMYITFADGIAKMQNVLTITAPVAVYGKTVPTFFIVLPEAKNNKTLLGVGFIEDALMVINLPQLTCRFLDTPSSVFDLKKEDITETVIGEVVSDVALPELLSPMPDTPEKCKTPKQCTHVIEMSLHRPYGPSFSVGLAASPLMTVKRQLEPSLADEAPSTSVHSMSTSQLPLEDTHKSYGPLIPIDLRTPPHKRQRCLQLNGYSPIMDALYRDAMRAVNESPVELSPDSKGLFGSPTTKTTQIDVEHVHSHTNNM